MNSATEKFLNSCLKYGIKRVAIGVADARIPRSMNFPFGPTGSAFTLESARTRGWPSIWDAASDVGVYSGCGNTAQAGVNTSLLDIGYWHYRADRGWRKA